MQDQQKLFVDALKNAKNILVTVSNNPSIDQLAATIGLALTLNKLNKHATAVYSGETPSVLQFLKPEETLEPTTDSLRDFIIALDKNKADRLRYKVDKDVVRIFITPFHTAISEKDLDFSQGDFNVDLVVALGVHSLEDIDNAVREYGRILHDAVITVASTEPMEELGTVTWVQEKASSLSEMILIASQQIDPKALDAQIATAFLTGIVSSTERFSNDRTTPVTMSASATLMAAGANQQLITSQLEVPPPPPELEPVPEPMLEPVSEPVPEPAPESAIEPTPQPEIATESQNMGERVVESLPAPEPAEPSAPETEAPAQTPPADPATPAEEPTSAPEPAEPAESGLPTAQPGETVAAPDEAPQLTPAYVPSMVPAATPPEPEPDDGEGSVSLQGLDALNEEDGMVEIHVDDNGKLSFIGQEGEESAPAESETAPPEPEPTPAPEPPAEAEEKPAEPAPEPPAQSESASPELPTAPAPAAPHTAVHRQLLNPSQNFGGPLAQFGGKDDESENFDPSLVDSLEEKSEEPESTAPKLEVPMLHHNTTVSASSALEKKYSDAVNAALPSDGIPKPPSAAMSAPPVPPPTPAAGEFNSLSSLGITNNPTSGENNTEENPDDAAPPPPVPPPMIPPM